MTVSSAHLTERTLERFARRELPPDELLAAGRHLSECEECRGRAGATDPAALRAALRPDPAEPAHLDPETELIPYACGTADAATREIVETHAEACASCRADLRDLETLRAVMRPRRMPRIALAAAAAAIAIALLLVLFANRPAPRALPSHPTVAVHPPPPPPAYARPEWEPLVQEARRTGTLRFPPDLARLRGESNALRGAGGAPAAELAPAGIVVDDTRPRFTWPERRGATYVVSLYENDEEIAHSPALAAPEWRPERELRRGRTYAWQVEVRRGDALEVLPPPTAPEARFRIAGEDEHRQIEEAKRAHPDDHLLHAVLYARAGLEAEARAAWERARHEATP
ncbi:MAG TPA: hypothetical protein VEO54_03120 [Thermoanaerobaculia bacterium]|nr:hypothetical protein [Thermoanaerobaculia bacterium]